MREKIFIGAKKKIKNGAEMCTSCVQKIILTV